MAGPGLIQQQMQPPGGNKPDPKMVEQVVLAAVKIIHDPQASQQLIAQMKQIGDPVQALAQITVMIMKSIYEKTGRKLDPAVLGAAGVEVLQELARVAVAAHLFQVDMNTIKQAAQLAIQIFQQGNTQAQPSAPPDAGAPAAGAPAQGAPAPAAQPAAAAA